MQGVMVKLGRKKVKYIKRKVPAVLLACASVLMFSPSQAAELNAGDIISAANIDQVMNDTFEGHTIRELVTDKVEYMIRNHGLKIPLKNSEVIEFPEIDRENTQKYAGDVKIDPNTLEVTGYKSGTPFPEIDVNDPLGGHKALWNYYYQNTYGNMFEGNYTFLFINTNRGVERTQRWYTLSLKMKGRRTGEPVLGDGSLVKKQLLYATEPYDIRGIGIYTQRYDSPKLEDNWAYVKSVRRTRQLSGSSWMDNLAGGVQLNDEYDGFSGRPSWYPESKIVRKRWVLAVAHLPAPLVVEGASNIDERYPTLDLQNAPYAMPTTNVKWEPREVYEIELKMPPEHPYSKRVMYMETQFPRIYNVEHYGKGGDFAKISFVFSRPIIGGEGTLGMLPDQGICFDINRQEAFVYLVEDGVTDRPNVGPQDVTLGQLEAAAQ
ncbi:DUF1329 domain-containing protein [Parvibaculum sp.]|uniref:DUF1329 domain-containing protein n=1 Tax=Parvibaculum sp. TaxID=2024848 RepID=UPI002731E05C|nr:DUF1329 domain-containing protein [Parvibaculum sp.]MDP1627382.1 DUF1329 domain-containing protein [Parvibaculum sp.]MDP3327518.1 DUF1329 domain-containing protein [Parvibaculum sp.]